MNKPLIYRLSHGTTTLSDALYVRKLLILVAQIEYKTNKHPYYYRYIRQLIKEFRNDRVQ